MPSLKPNERGRLRGIIIESTHGDKFPYCHVSLWELKTATTCARLEKSSIKRWQLNISYLCSNHVYPFSQDKRKSKYVKRFTRWITGAKHLESSQLRYLPKFGGKPKLIYWTSQSRQDIKISRPSSSPNLSSLPSYEDSEDDEMLSRAFKVRQNPHQKHQNQVILRLSRCGLNTSRYRGWKIIQFTFPTCKKMTNTGTPYTHYSTKFARTVTKTIVPVLLHEGAFENATNYYETADCQSWNHYAVRNEPPI